MGSARDIAREFVPYVVVFWAPFALLGGALENTRSVEAGGGHLAVNSGIGLCAITVARVVRDAARRSRSLLRRTFKFFEFSLLWSVYPGTLGPAAYYEPLPLPPSLQLLQILRA